MKKKTDDTKKAETKRQCGDCEAVEQRLIELSAAVDAAIVRLERIASAGENIDRRLIGLTTVLNNPILNAFDRIAGTLEAERADVLNEREEDEHSEEAAQEKANSERLFP